MAQQPDYPLSPAQLDGVWLAEVQFSESPDFDFDSAQGRVTYNLDWKIEAAPAQKYEDTDSWFTDVRFSVHVLWERHEGYDGPNPFDVSLAVRALFSWPTEPEDDRAARSWVEFNGIHILWPYVRNYVSTITGMGGTPPLILYTIAVQRPLPFEEDLEQLQGSSARAEKTPNE